MKTIILNASPRRDGNISRMLRAMEEALADAGREVVTFEANSLDIAPCTGCMVCRKAGKCVLPADDSVRFLDALRGADSLIVGAPCYWGNIPGTLKMLFDRIVYGLIDTESSLMPRPLMKSRRAVIVTTSTTPFPFNRLFHQSAGASRALREILGHSGFRIVADIQKGGTRKSPVPSDKLIRKCKKIALKLC